MATINNSSGSLQTDHWVARETGLSKSKIRRMRLNGEGPKWIKLGGASIRYKPEDVWTWIESCPTGGGRKS